MEGGRLASLLYRLRGTSAWRLCVAAVLLNEWDFRQMPRSRDTMATVMGKTRKPRLGRPPAHEIDRHVGARMRERRVMLGLTQQQMAELIGVTYQQAHKYEKGINRIAAGRLHNIAQALGVEVSYFFEGLESEEALKVAPQQRKLLELARNFSGIPTRKHQEALCLAGARAFGPRTGRGSKWPALRGHVALIGHVAEA
jgi:transcriptional regulator with XRE-family HTH domain